MPHDSKPKDRIEYDNGMCLPIKYKMKSQIPKGVIATDELTGTDIMITRFENILEDKQALESCVTGMMLLQHFSEAKGIEDLVDIFTNQDGQRLDVYFSTTLMKTNLHNIIKSPQELSVDHFIYLTYLLVRTLKYAHSAGGFPGSVEPQTVWVNQNCDILLTTCSIASVGRNYKSPEIVFRNSKTVGKISSAVDMWSVGLILGELLLRAPLFTQKSDSKRVIEFAELLGAPTEDDLLALGFSQQPHYLQAALELFDGLSLDHSLNEKFPTAPPMAVDLLSKVLLFNPLKRLTPTEALQHPFFETLHFEEDEPICERFSWCLSKSATVLEIKELLWEQIRKIRMKSAASCLV